MMHQPQSDKPTSHCTFFNPSQLACNDNEGYNTARENIPLNPNESSLSMGAVNSKPQTDIDGKGRPVNMSPTSSHCVENEQPGISFDVD